MSDLRKAAQDVVDTWKIYGTAESLRGWMDILEAALAQEQEQPEPAQEPVGEMRLSKIIEGMVVPVVPAELPVGTKLYTAPPQRPADPVQEPVAWMWEETARRSSTGIGGIDRKLLFCRPADEPWKRNITPLYTAPPQRPPLTDEEIDEIFRDLCSTPVGASYRTMARAIERAVRGEA